MGALKTVNNIDIHYQYADFSVETPGYWKLRAQNDFDNGDLVKVNGVPTREYHHKQVLRLDFSKLGDVFTDSVRMTLTNLLNEVFVTLFADNQPFISAVTLGSYEAPLTYSLALAEDLDSAEKCIFIIEDSQLDIGLLIAVERNANRIFQIISDYLSWNEEQIEESIRKQNAPVEEKEPAPFDVYAEDGAPEKKKGFFGRIVDWFKGLFRRKKSKTGEGEQGPGQGSEDGLTPRQKKKAERAAARAAEKAEKQAAREQKKAQKQEEKLRREQEKAAKKEAKAAQGTAAEESPAGETAETNTSGEETPGENGSAEGETEAVSVEDTAEEIPAENAAAEENPTEADEGAPAPEQSEVEVSEDA